MEMQQNDFDRIIFFEHARKKAEEAYAKNPFDADNLIRWGGALLELSHCQDGEGCLKMIEDAVSKLEEALLVNPLKHNAMWFLGNAHTSRGFITQDHETAMIYFNKASQCFMDALHEDPRNELYVKSLDMSYKAPELHLEVHRQMSGQQASVGESSTSNVKASKQTQKKISDMRYDILGWVILAAGIVAWVGMAKSHVPSPSSH